jgi:hypothetical protein
MGFQNTPMQQLWHARQKEEFEREGDRGLPSVILSHAASTSGPMPVHGDCKPKLPLNLWTSYSIPASASGTKRFISGDCTLQVPTIEAYAIARVIFHTLVVARVMT